MRKLNLEQFNQKLEKVDLEKLEIRAELSAKTDAWEQPWKNCFGWGAFAFVCP